MKKFYATEAAFRLVCFAYNLMQGFQRAMGIKTKRTPGVVRNMVLACGAELGRDGRRMALRLAAAGKRREMFAERCRRIFYWENGDCVAVESG